jgi:hypothetical protein
MRSPRIFLSVALAGAAFFLARGALAGNVPNPPPQVCINNQCVQTPAGSTGGKVKWNPGHYMASDAVMSAGKTLSYIQPEMDDLNHQDAIPGYRINITWGALEPTQGNYDFSVVDAILNRLKTAYNQPKHLLIYLWMYGGALRQNDGSVVPLYIQQGQQYGPSPVGGSYGWWGMNSNGASTGRYAPALYRPAVMARLIALVQALGQHYDGDPYFEGITFQEDSGIAQSASSYANPDPNYSDDAWLAQLERLLSASTAAFPHTNVIMDNSWFDRPADAVALEQWMASNRIGAGSDDMVGQTTIQKMGYAELSDGMQTLLGVDPNGGTTDLRPRMSSMMSIELDEMVTVRYVPWGGPWTAVDLVNALNNTYHASYAFWTHYFGNEVFSSPVPVGAKWSNLAATLAQNPLTNTGYPANYPQ